MRYFLIVVLLLFMLTGCTRSPGSADLPSDTTSSDPVQSTTSGEKTTVSSGTEPSKPEPEHPEAVLTEGSGGLFPYNITVLHYDEAMQDPVHYMNPYIDPNFSYTAGVVYILDERTGETFAPLEERIEEFAASRYFLFLIPENQRIVQADVYGDLCQDIYTPAHGQLRSVEYYDKVLYFIDGDWIVSLNLETGESRDLLEWEGLSRIGVWYGYLTISVPGYEYQKYAYHVASGELITFADQYEMDRWYKETEQNGK